MKKLFAITSVFILAFCVLGAASSPLNDGFFPSYVDGVANPAFVDGMPGYFINDNFTTPLAAGAVNGTNAEPGPGDGFCPGSQLVVHRARDNTGPTAQGP